MAKRGRKPTVDNPNPADVHVGAQLRKRRTLLGLSQHDLASQLDITFQQVQKYENGKNRISCGRLWDISRYLNVAIAYFYEGLEKTKGLAVAEEAKKMDGLGDVFSRKETLDLVRAYYKIEDSATRKKVLDIIKNIKPE